MSMPSGRGSLSQVSKSGFSLGKQNQIYMTRKLGRRAAEGRHECRKQAGTTSVNTCH